MCPPSRPFRIHAAAGVVPCLTLLPLTRPAGGADPPPTATATRPAPRVGTFDPRAVAVAYYRSPLHGLRVRDAAAEYRKAKDAGDRARAERLQAEGAAGQKRAHLQVFGNGPYDTLADDLTPVAADVAAAAGVDVIVPKVFYARPGTEAKDVTEALLEALKADDKTRQTIQELREKIRTGSYDPGEYTGAEPH